MLLLLITVFYQIIMSDINLITHASLGEESLFLMKAFLQFNFFHGLHHAETGVRIYDYVDSNIPILDEMSEKRKTDYKSLGNTVINSKLLPCSLLRNS